MSDRVVVLADSLPISLAQRETALPPWQLSVQQAMEVSRGIQP